jgi:endonuclease YncB( thermonuclease family)
MNQTAKKAELSLPWQFGSFIALTLCCVLISFSLSHATEFSGKVVGVKDGDSLIVRQDNSVAREARLWGIDAPEYRQAYSKAARRHLSSLTFGKKVRVLVRDTDRYGRIVAEIITSDGRNVNQVMVRAGYAWWFKKYAPNDGTLPKLESEARNARREHWVN